MSKEPEIRKGGNHPRPEKTFHTKAQLQAYLIDKLKHSKNNRINLHVIIT